MAAVGHRCSARASCRTSCAGPISLAANLHVAASVPVIRAIEYPYTLAPAWAAFGTGTGARAGDDRVTARSPCPTARASASALPTRSSASPLPRTTPHQPPDAAASRTASSATADPRRTSMNDPTWPPPPRPAWPRWARQYLEYMTTSRPTSTSTCAGAGPHPRRAALDRRADPGVPGRTARARAADRHDGRASRRRPRHGRRLRCATTWGR